MNILFVCTGNIYRSMTAEKCMRAYLSDNNISGWNVSSAGIRASKRPILDIVSEKLKEYGISTNNHMPRQLSREIAELNDIIIAMAPEHKEYIMENYGKTAFLFNEICCGNSTPVLDVCDCYPNWESMLNSGEIKDCLENTIEYIHDSVELLFKNLNHQRILKPLIIQ